MSYQSFLIAEVVEFLKLRVLVDWTGYQTVLQSSHLLHQLLELMGFDLHILYENGRERGREGERKRESKREHTQLVYCVYMYMLHVPQACNEHEICIFLHVHVPVHVHPLCMYLDGVELRQPIRESLLHFTNGLTDAVFGIRRPYVLGQVEPHGTHLCEVVDDYGDNLHFPLVPGGRRVWGRARGIVTRLSGAAE